MKTVFDLAKKHHMLETQIAEQIADISAAVQRYMKDNNIQLEYCSDIGYLQEITVGLENCDMVAFVGDSVTHIQYTYIEPYDGSVDTFIFRVPAIWSTMSDKDIVKEIVSNAIAENEEECARELAEIEHRLAKHGYLMTDNGFIKEDGGVNE